jgi:D-alanyl-D-alanine carboxypeptidase
MMAVCALVLAACTSPADANPDGREEIGTPFDAEITGRLDTALAEAMTLSGSSGAIAGVWAPWAGQWLVSPGTTTIGGSTPLSTDMHFRIGDNTRSMTCTVLLRLVDDGVVKLSDPVSDYLERLSEVDGITLGQLCQNTSGLSDYAAGLAPYFVNNPTREWPPLEVFSNGHALSRLGEPGSVFGQSRTGLVLLGMALEAATNTDWPTLYRQHIFEPLGLGDTSFPSSGQVELPTPHPHGYAAALTPTGQTSCEIIRDETQLSPSMSWVAGGAVSTAPDLKVWVEALADGSLLSEKSAKAQWATVPISGAAPWQGFGLGAQQIGPFRGDSGTIPGYLSAMLSDPASGLTIVVMLNNSHAGSSFVQALAQRLASIASAAPPLSGESAPELSLPWTEEEIVASIAATPVCPPPAAPAVAG